APSPHAQHSTVDVSQLHDPHSYSQHSIQVQHIQVAEPTGTVQANAQVSAQPLSPSSQQAAQELSSAQLTPVTLAQGQPLQTSTSQTQGAAQHAYLPSNWNYRSYPEIQMMALPHTQYVIAEASTPVTAAVNSSQVKTTHYVIAEGQTELDGKQVNVPSTAAQVHPDPLEQPAVSQQTTTHGAAGGCWRSNFPHHNRIPHILFLQPNKENNKHECMMNYTCCSDWYNWKSQYSVSTAWVEEPKHFPQDVHVELLGAGRDSGQSRTEEKQLIRREVEADEAVSQTLHRKGYEEEKEEKEKCALENRVNHIRSYLQDRLHLPCNGEVIVRQTAENQQASINPQQDAGHIEPQVNVLADGLAVSLLYEPLPDPSEPHVRGLLTRLEAVSQTLHRKGYEEDKEEKEKCALENRVNHIRSYLQDRVSGLCSLLQVQRECDASVCAVQSGLQKRWALLKELHTRVTLRPDSTQEAHDPHAVLTDTESLFSELSRFKSKAQQCRTQLETSINLLQALRSSHQGLNETFGTTINSTWTKELLQSNTDLFSEIHEDFMSLEQQTSNFVIHLRGLNASEEGKTRLSVDRSQTSLPTVPVYVAASEAAQLHSDPESDPESLGDSQKAHTRVSPFHKLCDEEEEVIPVVLTKVGCFYRTFLMPSI
ncbi:uncharacterized protein, partial [Sinocyclocheilus grahami]|uniref:uncharacterized protein n=1 Tax=Sinocyclocheilus grahami TaxID=75366 RepID=UPI0007ACAE60